MVGYYRLWVGTSRRSLHLSKFVVRSDCPVAARPTKETQALQHATRCTRWLRSARNLRDLRERFISSDAPFISRATHTHVPKLSRRNASLTPELSQSSAGQTRTSLGFKPATFAF